VEDNTQKIKEFILGELRKRAGDIENINMEENLIESGVIDSFGFLELLMSLEQEFNIQINFAELDPAEFTTLEGLTFHCGKAMA
jgi:acyl carrier protein